MSAIWILPHPRNGVRGRAVQQKWSNRIPRVVRLPRCGGVPGQRMDQGPQPVNDGIKDLGGVAMRIPVGIAGFGQCGCRNQKREQRVRDASHRQAARDKLLRPCPVRYGSALDIVTGQHRDRSGHHRPNHMGAGSSRRGKHPPGVASTSRIVRFIGIRSSPARSVTLHPPVRLPPTFPFGGFELGRQGFSAGPWTRQIRLVNSERLPVTAFC